MTVNANDAVKAQIDMYRVFDFAKDEKHVFLTSDLLLGTAALWLPILLGIILFPHSNPWAEVVKLLDAGSGYTFALPFLTASASFLFLERARRKVNSKREQIAPSIVMECVIHLIIGLILVGVHFTALIFNKDAGSPFLNALQVVFLVAVLRLGRKLFCLKNIDKLPDELMQYRQNEQENATSLRAAAKRKENF